MAAGGSASRLLRPGVDWVKWGNQLLPQKLKSILGAWVKNRGSGEDGEGGERWHGGWM